MAATVIIRTIFPKEPFFIIFPKKDSAEKYLP